MSAPWRMNMSVKSIVMVLVAVVLLGGCTTTVSKEQVVVPKFGVHEVVLKTPEKFGNPFWDAVVTGTFWSPSGQKFVAEGFYYGGDEWRVRFAPRETGAWTYVVTLKGKDTVVKRGAFLCEGQVGDGFLRVSKKNPYRMEYDTGRPFVPIGIQTCSAIRKVDMDGPTEDGKWRAVPMEEWVKGFTGAISLHRLNLSPGLRVGCAVPLIPDMDKPDCYELETCKELDKMYVAHRAAGMSEIAILFQDMSTYGKHVEAFGMGRDTRDYKNLKAANLPLQEKYIRYVVARYGCYVDIWEMFNEDSFAPDDYLAHLAKVIRKADPYRHIITTNFERPEQDFCEIVCPHEYMNIPAEEVDAHLTKQIAGLKSFGKPVQYTEFGNKGNLSNVDPIKWRVAAWTAYMNESGMLFWSMSGTKTKPKEVAAGNSNTYIGPDSRQHFRVLLNFAKDLPVDMRPRFGMDSPGFQFRSYILSNGTTSAVYLHRRGGYKGMTTTQGFRVTTGPGRYVVQWINPEDGKAVGGPQQVGTAEQFLHVTVPAFSVDLACRIDRTDSPLPAPPEPTGVVKKLGEMPVPAGWKVAWTADLKDPKFVEQWLVSAGSMDVTSGTLCLRSDAEGEGEATIRVKSFPEAVRVEYVGYLVGEDPCDMLTLLNANSVGTGSGYAVQFAGGKDRGYARVLNKGKPVLPEGKMPEFVVGRAYHIVAERDGNVVRLLVDGKKVVEVKDDKPPTERGLDRVGLYTFNGMLCVKEMRVMVRTSGN